MSVLQEFLSESHRLRHLFFQKSGPVKTDILITLHASLCVNLTFAIMSVLQG